ncbi:hypothetical protein J6590_047051, partial [Homalodisca vitripennis]
MVNHIYLEISCIYNDLFLVQRLSWKYNSPDSTVNSSKEVVALWRGECAISVVAEMWNLEHRTFVMRRFYANGESVTKTQRDFRAHFNIARHGAIPDHLCLRRNLLDRQRQLVPLRQLKECALQQFRVLAAKFGSGHLLSDFAHP